MTPLQILIASVLFVSAFWLLWELLAMTLLSDSKRDATEYPAGVVERSA